MGYLRHRSICAILGAMAYYYPHPQYIIDEPLTSYQLPAISDSDARLQMSEVPSASVSQLDPNFYRPTEAEVAFFKRQTGIDDDEELKEHIIKIQHEAWDVRSKASPVHLFLPHTDSICRSSTTGVFAILDSRSNLSTAIPTIWC